MIGAKGMAAVSIYPTKSLIIEEALTPELLEAYYTLQAEFLHQDKSRMIGTWFDKETGKTWLDVIHVTDLENAIDLGKEHNQKAVFDLENIKEISTGGTGEAA